MKAIVVLLLVIGVGVFTMYYVNSKSQENFDPTQQGRQARTAVESCKSWTEVLERLGEPRKWRNSTSNFDFVYTDRFEEKTGDLIARQLDRKALPSGFSFYYRFSDAYTFAVNFNGEGKLSNVQDKEGKDALMDEAGG